MGSVGPPMSLPVGRLAGEDLGQLVGGQVADLALQIVVDDHREGDRRDLVVGEHAFWSMPDFSEAKMSDMPRSTAPCEICVRPVPLPPAPMEDCVPCTVSNSAAASLMSGCNAEEPEAESFLPARVASFVPPAPCPPVPAVRSAAVAVQASRLS